YAKWTALTYTITFDVQGGTPISNQMVTYDQAYTLPTAVKTGYTFTGWTLDGEAFTEGTWNLLENITLVATYEANSYTITFDVSGGTPISDQTVTYDQAYTLPTAEKTGYTFDGWTLSGSPFGAGTWNLLEDITLVATYEANVYTLTYENLQGTSHSNPATYTIEDETIELTDPSARTGYTFAGWYTQLSGGVEVTEIAQGSTGNKTLYARWTAITYTITYGNLQGTNHINPTTYTVETEDINLLDPSALEHYTFSGWFTEETGGTEITVIETQTADHLTIYAQWIPVDYTISFDIDGTITTIDRPYGSNLVESDIPTIPAKANYDVTAPSWDHNPLGYQVVGDYTFVAIYVGNPMTVTYVTNEGSLVPDDIVAYGSLLVIPEVPTRNGYHFVAWYQDSDLANIYDFNVEVTASMTLYAQWEREFYTWEIESIFQREDLENSSIAIDPDQPSVLYEYINLFYGQELSPIQTYEGYLFDHFTYDGIDYSSIDQLIMVTGNRLDTSRILVYYHRIIITITFSQDPDLFTDPEEPLVSFRIYYNQSFDIPESLVDPRDPAGGLAVWDRTQFDYLKQDLTVYALYYATGVKSVTFIDRGIIRYVASEIGEETTVIGLSSILWNLNRPGYKFMGWFTEEEGGTLLPKAIYEFDDFLLNQNYLYARWMLLEPFSQPENVLVTVDETSIVMSWTLDPATINGNEPSGFEYLINNVLIEDLVTVPVLSGTTYTLTLLDSNPEFVLFEDLLNPGLHEISIRALGDNDNHYDGEFSDVYTFKNASIFDEDPTEVATYDYFIIETFGETKRYVFYTNLEYQFGASYTFEMVSGDEYASASANKIITKGLSGSFKFRMIREGHPT
ncbi:MAG: InlB B-repeat-containing protein, partial [Acholeplasmataceae bacterium]|nr:InlB B-repeat-containing protein [Acholeplasmataceae bacterium]